MPLSRPGCRFWLLPTLVTAFAWSGMQSTVVCCVTCDIFYHSKQLLASQWFWVGLIAYLTHTFDAWDAMVQWIECVFVVLAQTYAVVMLKWIKFKGPQIPWPGLPSFKYNHFFLKITEFFNLFTRNCVFIVISNICMMNFGVNFFKFWMIMSYRGWWIFNLF